MALTPYEKTKRWRKREENTHYNAEYMRKRREAYKMLYVAGKIAYDEIPKAYRYFSVDIKKK